MSDQMCHEPDCQARPHRLVKQPHSFTGVLFEGHSPKIGTIIHVGYPEGITSPIPCRAAIVTGIESDGYIPVQVVPAWSNVYPAKVTEWHRIEECPHGH